MARIVDFSFDCSFPLLECILSGIRVEQGVPMADESQASGAAGGDSSNATPGAAPATSSEYIKLKVVGQVMALLRELTYLKVRFIIETNS